MGYRPVEFDGEGRQVCSCCGVVLERVNLRKRYCGEACKAKAIWDLRRVREGRSSVVGRPRKVVRGDAAVVRRNSQAALAGLVRRASVEEEVPGKVWRAETLAGAGEEPRKRRNYEV